MPAGDVQATSVRAGVPVGDLAMARTWYDRGSRSHPTLSPCQASWSTRLAACGCTWWAVRRRLQAGYCGWAWLTSNLSDGAWTSLGVEVERSRPVRQSIKSFTALPAAETFARLQCCLRLVVRGSRLPMEL